MAFWVRPDRRVEEQLAPAKPPTAATPSVGLLAPLGHRDYRWALGGRLFSLTGDFAQSVILAVLVLDITQRPSGWGTLLTLQAVPRVLLMLVGGVAVDHFQARSVMLASNLLQALTLAALLGWSLLGEIELAHLYAYAVVSGVAFAFFLPASQSIVPELLPREQVRGGNALWLMAFHLARFIGPPVVGTLVAVAGHVAALAATVTMFLLGAAALGPIHSGPSTLASGSPLAQMREGLRAARRDEAVWAIILLATVYNFGNAAATFVGLPTLAKLELGAGDQGVGILYGALGAGALVGALATGLVAGIPRQGVVGAITNFGGGLPLVAAALMPSIWTAVPLLVVAGAFQSAGGVIFLTLVQTRTAPEVRGRVMALLSLSLFGLTPLAYGVGGLLGDVLGPRGILAAGGGAIVLTGLILLCYKAVRDVE